MKKIEFIKKLAEYCELDEQELFFESTLKSIDGYDSLAVMAMIAFVDENFNVKLSTREIENLSDFDSLIKLIGEEKFE